MVPISCVKTIVDFATSNVIDNLPISANQVFKCNKWLVGLGPILIWLPKTDGPYSLMEVTTLVLG